MSKKIIIFLYSEKALQKKYIIIFYIFMENFELCTYFYALNKYNKVDEIKLKLYYY